MVAGDQVLQQSGDPATLGIEPITIYVLRFSLAAIILILIYSFCLRDRS